MLNFQPDMKKSNSHGALILASGLVGGSRHKRPCAQPALYSDMAKRATKSDEIKGRKAKVWPKRDLAELVMTYVWSEA
jgi:hypothetical protein